MSWFSQQWNRFAGQPDDDPNVPISRVEIVWGRDRFNVQIDEEGPGQATLRTLKSEVSRITGVPYEQVKLIKGGFILKDEKAPLAAFDIRNGSRLTLVGTQGGVPIQGDKPGAKSSVLDNGGPHRMTKGEEMAQLKKQREEDFSEEGMLRRINETLASVRKDLEPEVKQFEALQRSRQEAAAAAAAATTAIVTSDDKPSINASAQREVLAKQHRKLSELLLRSLLALDGVNVNTDLTRLKRKEAVKEVQGLLDRVDATWSQLKKTTSTSQA